MVSDDDRSSNRGLLARKEILAFERAPLAVERLQEVNDAEDKESSGTAHSD